MYDDALFQSGMGSVDAPRTEERLTNCAQRAGSDVFRPALSKRRVLQTRAYRMARLRGNSARALMQRRTPGDNPV